MKTLSRYKILITGFSGSGKSYFAKNLKEQGYNSIDADEMRELTMWIDNKTKSRATDFLNWGTEWFKSHSWVWDIDHLEKILNSEEKIFIIGGAMNESSQEVKNLFDYIFYLDVNKKSIFENLNKDDRDNDWGKDEETLQFLKEGFPAWAKNIPKSWIPLTARDDAKKLIEEIEDKIGYKLEK